MCVDSSHDGPPLAAVPLDDDPNAHEPFPWQSGRIYDAHCHPTDTMASLADIPAMGAAALTVMATRAQDQDLVAALADDQGLESPTAGEEQGAKGAKGAQQRRKVAPAFGWHPWFSHQLYDDDTAGRGPHGGKDLTSMDDKRRHLASVLTPSPQLQDKTKAEARADEKDKDKGKEEALSTALDALAASLPAIRPLSGFLAETRRRLLAHPTALVGEIGVDKAFRVPEPAVSSSYSPSSASLTPGGREGRRLSPFRVQPAHQAAVLAAQLRLAAELHRPVSVHGVQAHGLLFSTLAATWRGHERDVLSRRQRRQIAGIEGIDNDDDDNEDEDEDESKDGEGKSKDDGPQKTYPPAICLHSFSGPVDMLRQYLDPHIPAAVYFSFSTAVNCSTENGCQRTAEVVAACPDDRLLVESDLHTAGPAMDAALEDMYRRVSAIKRWSLAEGVERIGQNYDAFILRATPPSNRKKESQRKGK